MFFEDVNNGNNGGVMTMTVEVTVAAVVGMAISQCGIEKKGKEGNT